MLIICLLTFSSFSLHSVVAATPTPSGPAGDQPTNLPKENEVENHYLIPLPLPAIDQINAPAGLTHETARRYVRSLAQRAAAPIVSKLKRLQGEGLVARYEVLPDLFAVAVETGQPATVQRALGTASLLPGGEGDDASVCVTGAAQALTEQVLAESVYRRAIAQFTGEQIDRTQANPYIQVYRRQGSPYAQVSGVAAANATVTMRILRGSTAVTTRTTTSSSSGYYRFYPTFSSCPGNSYDWVVKTGDVVEISAAGFTANTVVASIAAWADPSTDIVAGITSPGKSIVVELFNYSGSSCKDSAYVESVTSDSGGNFSAAFSSQVSFNGRAEVEIYVYDSNDNATTTYVEAYSFQNRFGTTSIFGTVKPNSAFEATLQRGASTVSNASGVSAADGWYNAYFGETILSGDLVTVSGTGFNLSYTAANLDDPYLNPTTNLLAGKTTANRYVIADFELAPGYVGLPSCSYDGLCSGVQANGSGDFSINPGVDIQRGDYAYLSIYDSNGNAQYFEEANAPVIQAYHSWYIEGLWRYGISDPLTVTVKDSGGVVKCSSSSFYTYSDGYFGEYACTDLLAGDKIEVTDGEYTESMTVSNLTGRLNNLTDHLSGSASNGKVVAELFDQTPPNAYTDFYCSEANVTTGSYDLTFSGANIGGWDQASVWNLGADGHFTYQYHMAFSVAAQKESDSLDGYTETPDAIANITLKRGGSTIATASPNADSTGYFYESLSPAMISEGDELLISTTDGNSVTIVIPKLTVNLNGSNNTIYGQAPANQGVSTYAYRPSSPYSSSSLRRTPATDATGNYSASYSSAWYGSFWSGCFQANMGHPCAFGETDYYRPDGHLLWLVQPAPAPAAADVYEPDDDPGVASQYSARQSHTFHQNSEVDWVKFNVTSEDVANGITFNMYTLNLGYGMDTVLELYDTDGATLLARNDDTEVGLSSLISWGFTAPGYYYLKALPYDDQYDTSYCDAVYDLMITPKQLYMPVIRR